MVQCLFATTLKPSGQTAHYDADISSRLSQISRKSANKLIDISVAVKRACRF
jgi:hypothetical protein